jgi:hypothetical protein
MEYARPAADSAGSSAAVLDSDNVTNLTRPDGLTSMRACEKWASATEVGCDVPWTGAGARSEKENREVTGREWRRKLRERENDQSGGDHLSQH